MAIKFTNASSKIIQPSLILPLLILSLPVWFNQRLNNFAGLKTLTPKNLNHVSYATR